jgi:hypothetical protein
MRSVRHNSRKCVWVVMEKAHSTKGGTIFVGRTFKSSAKQRSKEDPHVTGNCEVTEGSSLGLFGAVLREHGTDGSALVSFRNEHYEKGVLHDSTSKHSSDASEQDHLPQRLTQTKQYSRPCDAK